MTRQDYIEKGREAYQRGRVIIAGPMDRRFWQRRAFIEGYTAERAAWRLAHPNADELGAAADRLRYFGGKA